MKKSLLIFVLIIFCSGFVVAQNVSGVVYDEFGISMPGVTVLEKGSTNGTITGSDGNFDISVKEGKELIFSFIGYKTETVLFKGQPSIKVHMVSEFVSLDEVVAVGYGSRTKVNLIGAVENIDTDDFATRAITNASQALQGKVSGVIVTQNSGQPGQDGAEIRIRGVSSIENSNDPLVIIDGIEGQLSDVHPNDIASMSVLKDASSAAIYGNRAAAGVIIITTKTGTSGLNINAKLTSSVQQITSFPKVANAYEYATLLNEARLNSGFPNVPYDEESLERIQSGTDPRLQSVDLFDFYFSPALMQNYHVSISGGQKNYNFSFTAGYLDQDGVLYGTGAEKLTYRANLNSKFWEDKISIGASFGGYIQDEEELSSATPTVMAYNANSSPVGFLQAADPETGEPGLYGIRARYYAINEAGGGTTTNRNNVNYQFSAELKPLSGLKARVLYGQTIHSFDRERLLASVRLAGNPNEDISSTVTDSKLEQTYSTSRSSSLTTTIDYDKKLGSHKLNALIGYEYLTYDYNLNDFSVQFLLSNQPHFPFGDPETLTAGGQIRERVTKSYFSRLSYDFDDKYLLEANLRRDGSSRFSEYNRWGMFPSFAAAWRISQESFMDDLPIELKLRASWGKLGNERMKEYYPTYNRLDAGEYYSFGNKVVQGTGTTSLGNDDLVWEVSEQTNIGLDATFSNSISLTTNYFEKKTTRILGRVDIPYSLGLGTETSSKPYQNIGSMINKGLEASLQYNRGWKDWSISTNINLTYLENEVLDLGDLEYVAHNDVVSGYLPPADIIRSQVGKPFGSYFGFIADGIYQVNDFTWQNGSDPAIGHYDRLYVLKEGMDDVSAILGKPMPGDIKYADISGPEGVLDGKITEDDITFIGSSQPDFIYSLQFYAAYKNWSLNLLGQGVQGANAYIMGALVTPFWGGRGNISKDMVNNHWSFDNPSNEYQRVYDDSQRANIVSSYYLQDASYFRVKNIAVGYQFDNLKTIGLEELKMTLSVENAFLFSKMKGFDPEKSFNKITPDFHPQVRIYSLGLNLKF